jgi:hypothetical protein
MYRIAEPRRDLKPSASLGIHESGKHRGGVERRQAEKIDCPVFSYERDGMKVTDDPVVFYWRIVARLPTGSPVQADCKSCARC